MRRGRRTAAGLVAGLVAVLALAGCGTGAPRATGSGAVPVVSHGRTVVIGALPARSSLLLHGRAPLEPPDAATLEDLRTFAKQQGKDPAQVADDYAAQPAFDTAVQTAEKAHAGYADAVFQPGAKGASELRFTAKPPQRLLDALQASYPRDLRIEWGEHLAGDDARDRLSGAVTDVVSRLPDTGDVSSGIDGTGELTVDYDGAADPHAVADALLAAPAFRTTFVHGQPPTRVVVRAPKVRPSPLPTPPVGPDAARWTASCTSPAVRPFDCDTVELRDPAQRYGGFEAWFDVLDGVPRFVVGESEHLRSVPLRMTTTGATAAPAAAWAPEQRGCSPDSDCALDAAVERIFAAGAHLAPTKTGVVLTGGGRTLVGTRSGGPHRYARAGVVTSGGRVLLTYHDGGVHFDVADGGRLSVNAAGCLTDGADVLVLPDTTVLHPDGSIDIGGRHVRLGGTLQLGGGEGPVPADQRCGTGGYFYGWGA